MGRKRLKAKREYHILDLLRQYFDAETEAKKWKALRTAYIKRHSEGGEIKCTGNIRYGDEYSEGEIIVCYQTNRYDKYCPYCKATSRLTELMLESSRRANGLWLRIRKYVKDGQYEMF